MALGLPVCESKPQSPPLSAWHPKLYMLSTMVNLEPASVGIVLAMKGVIVMFTPVLIATRLATSPLPAYNPPPAPSVNQLPIKHMPVLMQSLTIWLQTTLLQETLPAALTAVPVIPSTTPTVNSQLQEEEANLTEAADPQPENVAASDSQPTEANGHHSSSTANTAILSTTTGHSAAAVPPQESASPPDPPKESATKAMLPPKPQRPATSATAKSSKPDAKSGTTPKRGPKIRPPNISAPTPPNPPDDIPDDESVESSKRNAASKIYLRKQTRLYGNIPALRACRRAK